MEVYLDYDSQYNFSSNASSPSFHWALFCHSLCQISFSLQIHSLLVSLCCHQCASILGCS